MKQQRAFRSRSRIGRTKRSYSIYTDQYLLSSSIKKIAVTDKPEVRLMEGNGQASISELSQVKQPRCFIRF